MSSHPPLKVGFGVKPLGAERISSPDPPPDVHPTLVPIVALASLAHRSRIGRLDLPHVRHAKRADLMQLAIAIARQLGGTELIVHPCGRDEILRVQRGDTWTVSIRAVAGGVVRVSKWAEPGPDRSFGIEIEFDYASLETAIAEVLVWADRGGRSWPDGWSLNRRTGFRNQPVSSAARRRLDAARFAMLGHGADGKEPTDAH